MKKHFETTTIIVAILIGIFLICSPILSLYNFNNIEREEIEEDTAQARNIVAAELQQLFATAGDYAGWDDSYAFMQDGSPKFISSSLGEAFLSKLRLNLFCMIANDGKMVFGTGYDYTNKLHTAITPPLLHHLKPGSPLLKPGSGNKDMSGFVSLPEGLMMIVSRPILTSEDKGPAHGTLIVGRFLDQTAMAEISKRLGYRIDVLNALANSKYPFFIEQLSRFSGVDDVLVKAVSEKQVTGHIQLTDIYGKVAGLIELEKPRHIYQQAKRTTWLMITLSISLCLTVITLFTLLRKRLVVVHRSEHELKDQLNSFIELAVDGIFSIGSSDSINNANTKVCEMTGYSRTELRGMRFGQLFEAEEEKELGIEALLKKKGDKGAEQTLIRKDGRHIVVELTSKKMPDGTFQSFMHDISGYKAMERKLVEYHNRVNSMALEVTIAEERERNRIAGELHDQVGPNLLLAKLKVEQLQFHLFDGRYDNEFEAIMEFISKSIHDIRSLTFQLRPPILANAGLEAALRWLAQDFGQNHGIEINVKHDDIPVQLEYAVRLALFQAVREMLLNIAKHADARQVNITVSKDPATLTLIVDDDGAGFSVPKDYAHSNSFGLFNTQQRIKYHGGQMHIDSSPGHGTRVFITIPLDRNMAT